VNAEWKVTPTFLIEDLAKEARGPRVYTTLDTNLPGAQTRTSVLFTLMQYLQPRNILGLKRDI